MGFPSSGIRAIELSASKLIVICPPFYGAAAFSFGIMIIMFLTLWFAAGRDLGLTGNLILVAVNLPFVVVTLGLALTDAGAVLDGQAGILHVRNRIFGFATQQKSIPFSCVDVADIQTSRASLRLAFRLKDGSTVPLGFFTNQAGHRAAVESINAFLRRSAVSSHACL